MEQVVGIGGCILLAAIPSARYWYREHLGVPVEPEQTYGALTSAAAGEQTVWSAVSSDTAYFGSGLAPFMVNYRVRNLDAMLAQPGAAGAQVDDRVEDYDFGRFGCIRPRGQSIRALGAATSPGQGKPTTPNQRLMTGKPLPWFSELQPLAGGPGESLVGPGGVLILDRLDIVLQAGTDGGPRYVQTDTALPRRSSRSLTFQSILSRSSAS